MLRSIFRYPVKSMLGERVRAVEVGAAGVAGDRRWAVVDVATGRVASAKHPAKWQRLLTVQTRALGLAAAEVEMVFADGRSIRSSDPDVDEMLAALVDRPVKLRHVVPAEAAIERTDPDMAALTETGEVALGRPAEGKLGAAADGTFFDFAPVHFVTTGTLERLSAALAPGGKVPVERFRPNLVLHVPMDGEGLVGRRVRIGPDVVLDVLVPTPRCAVPALRHGELPEAPDVLRAISRHHRVEVAGLGLRPCLGAYATVVTGGRITEGDEVTLDL